MSDPIGFTPSPAFDRAAQALDIGVESFLFNKYPAEQAGKLEARVKMAAKLLGKATGFPHSQALDAVAQALRFPAWHHLAAHLGRASEFKPGPLPAGWLDALGAAALLTVVPEDAVSLPTAQLGAFEAFGETLAMLMVAFRCSAHSMGRGDRANSPPDAHADRLLAARDALDDVGREEGQVSRARHIAAGLTVLLRDRQDAVVVS